MHHCNKKVSDGKPKSITDQSRLTLNAGKNLVDFLKRRRIRTQELEEPDHQRPVKGPDKKVYAVRELLRAKNPVLRTYMLDYQDHYFGLVFLGRGATGLTPFLADIGTIVRSLRRIEIKEPRYALKDPYKDSKLPMIEKRRAVRAKLADSWSAHDTEHFILISDMVSNTHNRRLLKDMLVDLEVMRTEYEKRFPPIDEIKAVSTVRVCNSFEGYLRYSKKPGTGGYWHPIAEELVLFNPSKTVKKASWMKKVTPKAILYHEAMHQYFHYSNGNVPPASWFNEGYGEFFGGSTIDRFQKKIRKIEKNPFRWGVVKKHLEDDKWPNLEKMLKMTQRQFYSRKVVSQNYAFGWAFCYFLEQERAKRPQERNEKWAAIPQRYIKNLRSAAKHYRKSLPDDAPKGGILRFAVPIQKKAFERTFRTIDLKKLEEAWIAALKEW